MIAELETNEKNKQTKARYKTPTTNRNNNKQSFQHPHIISEMLRYFIINDSDLIEQICYFLFYIVMSVSRFDTKLWLLLNNLLDISSIKRKKCANILTCFRFSGSIVNGKQLRQIYYHDIYFVIYSYICYLANLTEQT